MRFGQGGSKTLLGEFGGDEAVEIGERAEAGEFFGREGELERFLDQNDELSEREGIEAEVGGEADFLGGHLESRSQGTFYVALDDTENNRGEVRGVTGAAVVERGIVSGRRATLEERAKVVGGSRGGVGGSGEHGGGDGGHGRWVDADRDKARRGNRQWERGIFLGQSADDARSAL